MTKATSVCGWSRAVAEAEAAHEAAGDLASQTLSKVSVARKSCRSMPMEALGTVVLPRAVNAIKA